MTIDPEKVQEVLKQLDGSVRSAVKLLTGFSDEKLTELGGFSEEDSNCAEQQDESGLTHTEAWEAGYQAAVRDAVAKERVTQSQGVEAWGVTFPGGSMAVFAWQEDARRFQHTIANGAQLVRGRFIPTPESMLGPVSFDDSTDEELTPVKMVPVDEPDSSKAGQPGADEEAKLIVAHNMQLAENYRAQVDSADDEEDERSEFDKGYDAAQSQGVEAWGVYHYGNFRSAYWKKELADRKAEYDDAVVRVRVVEVDEPGEQGVFITDQMLEDLMWAAHQGHFFEESWPGHATLMALHDAGHCTHPPKFHDPQLAQVFMAQADEESSEDKREPWMSHDEWCEHGQKWSKCERDDHVEDEYQEPAKPPGDISMALHCVVYPGPDGKNGRRYWTEVGADAAATVDIAAGQRWESGRWYREAIEAAAPEDPTDITIAALQENMMEVTTAMLAAKIINELEDHYTFIPKRGTKE